MINIVATEGRALTLKDYCNGELLYTRWHYVGSLGHGVLNRLSLAVEVICSKEAETEICLC